MKPSKDLDERIEDVLDELEAQWIEDGGATVNGRLTAKQEAKQQLLALIEQREREARIDELEDLEFDLYYMGDQVKVKKRIEALKKGKS